MAVGVLVTAKAPHRLHPVYLVEMWGAKVAGLVTPEISGATGAVISVQIPKCFFRCRG